MLTIQVNIVEVKTWRHITVVHNRLIREWGLLDFRSKKIETTLNWLNRSIFNVYNYLARKLKKIPKWIIWWILVGLLPLNNHLLMFWRLSFLPFFFRYLDAKVILQQTITNLCTSASYQRGWSFNAAKMCNFFKHCNFCRRFFWSYVICIARIHANVWSGFATYCFFLPDWNF